jgi:LPXTG-site transpeptidase (sortase) family protein
VIGLDGTDVNAGPNEFPVGARVCNTGDGRTSNDLTAEFAFTTTNERISLVNDAEQTFPALDAGDCQEIFYTVRVSRTAAAYGSSRDYTITVTSGSATANIGQRLRVEQLQPIGGSSTTDIKGPKTVEVGTSYQWTVTGETPAAGYPELAFFLNFCPDMLRIESVETTFSVPPSTVGKNLWADGCQWDTQGSASCTSPTSTNYGGTFSYSVDAAVIAEGSCNITSMIYDFSNNAFHYNNDYGDSEVAIETAEIAAQATETPVSPTATTSSPSVTPGGPTATATTEPTRTPLPTNTPFGTPQNAPTDVPADQLPQTGFRARPAALLPAAEATLASPVQMRVTLAVIVVLMLGVLLAVWSLLMFSGVLPREVEANSRVLRGISVLFILSALVLVGMLTINLMRATQVSAPTAPQSNAGSGSVAMYLPPEVPATHLIVPDLRIDTELTEAPRMGGSWDVSGFYREIAHLEGTAYPGTTGNAVLAGHVHTDLGAGPFYFLRNLQPGNMIIARGDGIEYRYRVEWVKDMEPDSVDVLAPTGVPVLTLISCSDWNAAAWAYTNRVVVRASFFDRATIN